MINAVISGPLTPIPGELQETIDLSRVQHLFQNWCTFCCQASDCTCWVEGIYSKVVDIMGNAEAKPFVWKAAFHQAAVEAGIEPKSERMATVERMCNERAILESRYAD